MSVNVSKQNSLNFLEYNGKKMKYNTMLLEITLNQILFFVDEKMIRI